MADTTRTERAAEALEALQTSEHWRYIKPLWETAQFCRITARAEWLTESGRAAAQDCANAATRHLGDLLLALGVEAHYGDAQRLADRVVNGIDEFH